MSGKRGAKGTKATEVGPQYHPDFLDDMDGRGQVVRTLRQRLGALVSDLGGGANLSYIERSLCKRAIHLERLIEKKELALARGGTITESDYLNGINTLSGLCAKLGLKRRAKPTMSINEYMRHRTATPTDKDTR